VSQERKKERKKKKKKTPRRFPSGEVCFEKPEKIPNDKLTHSPGVGLAPDLERVRLVHRKLLRLHPRVERGGDELRVQRLGPHGRRVGRRAEARSEGGVDVEHVCVVGPRVGVGEEVSFWEG
jgi:hypothetical protein